MICASLRLPDYVWRCVTVWMLQSRTLVRLCLNTLATCNVKAP